jgi:hypothetical protein
MQQNFMTLSECKTPRLDFASCGHSETEGLEAGRVVTTVDGEEINHTRFEEVNGFSTITEASAMRSLLESPASIQEICRPIGKPRQKIPAWQTN